MSKASPSTNFGTEIDKLRVEIQRLGDEIAWLNDAPVPREELKARVTEGCRQMASRFQPRVGSLGHPNAKPFLDLMELFTISKSTEAGTMKIDNVGPILAWATGSALVQRLHDEIDALDYGQPGPPMAERPARLVQLKAKLREQEEREEALVCRADEAGETIFRRLDADPAVVLAYNPDGSTPKARVVKHVPPSLL